jgi:transcriptional regulator with XRE-family HTH domain
MKPRSLTSAQIRAARALIRWRAEDLARESAVGVATIRRAELAEEKTAMTVPNDLAIRRAFEAAGVEFLDVGGGGVLLRKPRSARPKGERERLRESLLSATYKGVGISPAALREWSQPMLPLDAPHSDSVGLNKSLGIETMSDVVLTSELIRAARALLRWEQRDLSTASLVSLPTIKRLEAKPGVLAGNATTVAALRRALEAAGIEFTVSPSPGVRFKGRPASTARDQQRKDPQK